MRYIFGGGGGNYYIAMFPLFAKGRKSGGGKIYHIAIFPPIQVKGGNGYGGGGGEWLYNTGSGRQNILVGCFFKL